MKRRLAMSWYLATSAPLPFIFVLLGMLLFVIHFLTRDKVLSFDRASMYVSSLSSASVSVVSFSVLGVLDVGIRSCSGSLNS